MATYTPRRAETLLRKFALSYREAYEEFPWGERVVKVAKKVFVFMGCGKNGLSLSTKMIESNEEALKHKFARPTGYNLGKSGWITATFGPRDKVPVQLLRAWIDESYRTIAPKRLVKSLAAPKSEPTSRRRSSSSRRTASRA